MNSLRTTKVAAGFTCVF